MKYDPGPLRSHDLTDMQARDKKWAASFEGSGATPTPANQAARDRHRLLKLIHDLSVERQTLLQNVVTLALRSAVQENDGTKPTKKPQDTTD